MSPMGPTQQAEEAKPNATQPTQSDTRFTELTVESQLSLQKVAGTVSPVSSVCL